MPSNRKELIYEIKRVPKGESLVNQVAAYWNAIRNGYSDGDRCIVFCRTMESAKELGNRLNVLSYHRDCPDSTPIHEFVEGKQKILPTTLKLGCGFHYPSVRDVIHLDLAYSMIDQYQEDSRGGRDGLPCRAITFVSESRSCPEDRDEFDIGNKAVYEWTQERMRCLRIGPSLFLDGTPVTCCLVPEAQLCLHCQKQVSEPPPTVARRLLNPKVTQLVTDPIPSISTVTPRIPQKRQIELETPQLRKRMRNDSIDPFLISPSIQKTMPSIDMHPMTSNISGRSQKISLSSMCTPSPIGSSGRSRVGLGVAMSAIQSHTHNNEWKNEIEDPIYQLLEFFQKNCFVCFLVGPENSTGGKRQYSRHRTDSCPTNRLRKGDPDYYAFRTLMNYPSGMCYGCGMHTGVIIFIYFLLSFFSDHYH